MLALPPPPAPAPKRQVLVATAMFAAAGAMLMGAFAAVWFEFRNTAGTTNWMPEGMVIPEVATNIMWATGAIGCAMAQWAVYAVKRGDRLHAGLAFGITFLLGLAMLNSQAYTWGKIELPVQGETSYNSMFYAFTGTVFALIIVGLIYVAVAGFRFLGGRTDTATVVGMAVYWYFLFAAVTTMWFVVYVTK